MVLNKRYQNSGPPILNGIQINAQIATPCACEPCCIDLARTKGDADATSSGFQACNLYWVGLTGSDQIVFPFCGC